jgi:hypothetical protein
MNQQSYDDIKAEVIKRMGGRQDLSARIDQWAMDAFTELTQAPKASFRELDALYEFTAPAGQGRVPVPADFWFILSLRDVTRKLDQVHWQVLDRTYRTVGIPTRFARYQDNIELDPIPAADQPLIMRYRRRLPKLQAGLPIPLEREWHELLLTLTVAKGLSALQRFEEALPFKQAADMEVGNRLDNPLLEDDGFETTIGVRFRY